MGQNRPVGIGVTGSGVMGRTHVEAAQRSPETRIVATADLPIGVANANIVSLVLFIFIYGL